MAIGVFPLLFNLFGCLKSGDIFYIVTEKRSLGALDFGGASRGFFHYFKVYMFIIGPVCMKLFFLGYFGFYFGYKKKFGEYVKKFDLIYVVFTITFLVQAMLIVIGTNPGT